MTHDEFARLADIGRYPVKGLGGESLAQAEIGQHGIRWDRAFAMSTTRIPLEEFGTWTSYEAFHALDARPDLGGHSATILETGSGGATLELRHRDGTSLALRVTPDGRVVTDENTVATIQSWFAGPGARAELISSGTHLWDVAYASVSIINLATIREISTAAGVPLDHRRFRANLYIDGLAPWDEFASWEPSSEWVRSNSTCWSRSSVAAPHPSTLTEAERTSMCRASSARISATDSAGSMRVCGGPAASGSGIPLLAIEPRLRASLLRSGKQPLTRLPDVRRCSRSSVWGIR